MKKIGIVIVYYKGEKDTLECLDSLSKIDSSSVNASTYLVDNNPESRIKFTTEKYKNINLKLIKSKENLGFSGGNNLGIKEALKENCDYVLLLNNDTIVKKDFLESLVNAFDENKKAGIVVPKIYFAKGFEFHKEKYDSKDLGKVIWYAGGKMDWDNILGHHRGVDEVDRGQFDKVENTDFASGCCMMIKSDVFEDVGLLDEKYFLYYEDSDFSERVRSEGFEIVFQPKSIIWHKNAGSSGGSGSSLQDYYITRNRLIFGNKYATLRTKFALNREAFMLLMFGRKAQKKGVKDFYLGKLGKGDLSSL